MWLQRVLFNVRHRLLSQKSDTSDTRAPKTPLPKPEERRAAAIHSRIADLDARCAQLQNR